MTAFPTPVQAETFPIVEEIVIPLTIEELIDSVSIEEKIASSTIYNILDAEHYGKEWKDGSQNEVVSKTGDTGLCQINLASWPEITEEQAKSPEWCIRNFMAPHIKKGEQWWLYTSCSCVTQMRAKGFKFPKVRTPADLQPNTQMALHTLVLIRFPRSDHMGDVVKFGLNGLWYDNGNADGNCTRGISYIAYNSPYLRGFYKPVNSS